MLFRGSTTPESSRSTLSTTGPDVVMEEEIEEKITVTYDSMNDPQVVSSCEQGPTPEEALVQLLLSNQPQPRPVQETSTHPTTGSGDAGELRMDSEMKEAVEGLMLSTEMTHQLGPPPGTLPNLEGHAATTTQTDLNKLRRPDGRSRQLSQAWRDTADYERQKAQLEKES